MSQTSGWKEFKIDDLNGDEIAGAESLAVKHKKPTKKQFLQWMVNIVNTLQALSLQWILLMALGLKFDDVR